MTNRYLLTTRRRPTGQCNMQISRCTDFTPLPNLHVLIARPHHFCWSFTSVSENAGNNCDFNTRHRRAEIGSRNFEWILNLTLFGLQTLFKLISRSPNQNHVTKLFSPESSEPAKLRIWCLRWSNSAPVKSYDYLTTRGRYVVNASQSWPNWWPLIDFTIWTATFPWPVSWG